MNSQLIRQAMLSEKVYTQMEGGTYTFLVSKDTTKDEIKKAIEGQFKVKVKKVNIGIKASKKRRVTGTRKMTENPAQKKAVVYLMPGEKIALLSPKSESKKDKANKKAAKSNEEKTEKKSLISRISSKKKEEGKK